MLTRYAGFVQDLCITSVLEAEIDQIVYSLYGLSAEQIGGIEDLLVQSNEKAKSPKKKSKA